MSHSPAHLRPLAHRRFRAPWRAALVASAFIVAASAGYASASVDILAPMQRGHAVCKERPIGYLAIRREGRGITLVPAQFTQRVVGPNNPVVDLFEFPAASPPTTCWVLETPTDLPLLLRGLPANEKVTHFPELQGLVRPGTDIRIPTSTGTAFTVRFPALDPRLRGPGAGQNVKILRIIAELWECRLGSTSFLDDKAGFEIVLAADFNGDGLPELVVENSPKGAFRHYEFFVSERSKNRCRATGVRKQVLD